MTNTTDKDISSCEMTALWRSAEPALSKDHLSGLLASVEGRQKTEAYEKAQYPLAPRHFSLRARYFYDTALKLLTANQYDSLVSIGSGFSLLTTIIASAYQQQNPHKPLDALDTDIEKIIQARQEKIKKIDTPELQTKHRIIDIEQAYQNKTNLTDLFGQDVKRPIIILEGVSYFLTPGCLQWLFQSVRETYQHAAIIWDYWPSNLVERSAFFRGLLNYFRDGLPDNENAQELITPEIFNRLADGYRYEDLTLSDLEKMYLPEAEYLLVDENDFVPAGVGFFYLNNLRQNA
jgi:O-methyltransferase involved in polyketide biosynthesis